VLQRVVPQQIARGSSTHYSCSMLQYGAVRLQCVAVCCSAVQCSAVLRCVAVCCSVLQCVAVCCTAARSEGPIDASLMAFPNLKSAYRYICMYMFTYQHTYIHVDM